MFSLFLGDVLCLIPGNECKRSWCACKFMLPTFPAEHYATHSLVFLVLVPQVSLLSQADNCDWPMLKMLVSALFHWFSMCHFCTPVMSHMHAALNAHTFCLSVLNACFAFLYEMHTLFTLQHYVLFVVLFCNVWMIENERFL